MEQGLHQSAQGTLLYNGELYEIPPALERKHQNDTSALLEYLGAHARDSQRLSQALRWEGMFAWVYWDRAGNRLLLGRDTLGIKPAYVYQDRDCLIVCSEIRPILELVPDRVRLNRRKLQSYFFTRHVIEDGETFFSPIRPLAPGTLQEYDLGARTLRERAEDRWLHWNLPKLETADLDEHFRANATQLTGDLTRAALVVSGGIDSALSAIYSRDVSGGLFYLEVPGKDAVEGNLPKIAQKLGSNIQRIRFNDERARQELASIYDRACGPLPTHSFISQYLFSKGVAESAPDLKVMIGGHGGDELFGGYEAYLHLEKTPGVSPSPYSGLGHRPLGIELDDFGYEDALAQAQTRWQAITEIQDPNEDLIRAILLSDIADQLSSVGIPEADLMTMSANIEYRPFFLTRRMLALALALPSHQRVSHETRPLLKALVQSHIPGFDTRKQGFPGNPNELIELVSEDTDRLRACIGLREIPLDRNRALDWKLKNVSQFLRTFERFL